MNKIENLYRENMKIIVNGGSVEDILKNAVKLMQKQIFLKDYYFNRCLYEKIDDENYINAYFDHMFEDITGMVVNDHNMIKIFETSVENIIIDDKKFKKVIVPIILNNYVYGILVMYGVEGEISELDILSLEVSAYVISMEMLKRISTLELENKYRSEFFEDLISSNEQYRKMATAKASYYDFDRYGRYSVMTIQYDISSDDPKTIDMYNSLIIHSMYMIDLLCKEIHKKCIVIKKAENIHLLFMWQKGEDYKNTVSNIVDNINNMLYHKINHLNYTIGIGRVYDMIDNVIKSFNDAKKALVASHTYLNQNIVDFDSLGVYKILCQENLQDELMAFYTETLKPLVSYDKRRDTELVKSLMYYFETNGNLKKMSEKLFAHYNTILYRINRIQEITGKNLDDEADRFGLQMALKIMKVLNIS